MPDILIEAYCEEIPARMQRPAAERLCVLLYKALQDVGLEMQSAETHVTPRRLCFIATGLPHTSPSNEKLRRGPRSNSPAVAIEGFARSCGVLPADLEIREDAGREHYFAVINTPGEKLDDILKRCIPDVFFGFRWPKSMRWGSGSFRWVRPLRSILAVVEDEGGMRELDFTVAGIRAGRTSYGNAAMGSGEFTLASIKGYRKQLSRRFVILESNRREQRIRDQAIELATGLDLELVEDAGLLEEIAGLVEWPVPMIEAIDPRFLQLPAEILVVNMRMHQKYLAARDRVSGKVTHFIFVANRTAPDGGRTIAEGNNMVLSARLEDAEFVWANDLRRIKAPDGLTGLRAGLARVSFHNRLGNLGERVDRIATLAAAIAVETGDNAELARAAAEFAKLDLISETVTEFPELQGVVGRFFAGELGLAPEIAAVCEDHYRPAGPSDYTPTCRISVIVGLADRIDQLAGFFGIGETPTGSKDPFALRRAALGIVRLTVENGIRLRMAPYVEQSWQAIRGETPAREVAASVMDFIHERLAVHLRARGIRHDAIAACANLPDSDDLSMLASRAKELTNTLHGDVGMRLLHGFRRANNIIEAERAKGGFTHSRATPELAAAPAEKRLFATIRSAGAVIEAAMAEEDFKTAMQAMADLADPIDDFFETVRVNAEETRVRENRLALLLEVTAVTKHIADLSLIDS
ncbi:MAG: glycine--tRNA ligase subunit beta [Rhodobacteraceae bacterium]|nr:glycine--tRNA ligase subunit beta [Paracoccaceae bacterium]